MGITKAAIAPWPKQMNYNEYIHYPASSGEGGGAKRILTRPLLENIRKKRNSGAGSTCILPLSVATLLHPCRILYFLGKDHKINK